MQRARPCNLSAPTVPLRASCRSRVAPLGAEGADLVERRLSGNNEPVWETFGDHLAVRAPVHNGYRGWKLEVHATHLSAPP